MPRPAQSPASLPPPPRRPAQPTPPFHRCGHLKTLQCAGLNACPNPNALDGWDTHQPHRQPCVEPPVPLAVTPQADGHPSGQDFKYPSARLSLRFTPLDIVDHLRLQLTIAAAHRRLLSLLPVLRREGISKRTLLSVPVTHRAYREHMTVYPAPNLPHHSLPNPP